MVCQEREFSFSNLCFDFFSSALTGFQESGPCVIWIVISFFFLVSIRLANKKLKENELFVLSFFFIYLWFTRNGSEVKRFLDFSLPIVFMSFSFATEAFQDSTTSKAHRYERFMDLFLLSSLFILVGVF